MSDNTSHSEDRMGATKHRPEQPPTKETQHWCPVHGKHGDWEERGGGTICQPCYKGDRGRVQYPIAPDVVEAIEAAAIARERIAVVEHAERAAAAERRLAPGRHPKHRAVRAEAFDQIAERYRSGDHTTGPDYVAQHDARIRAEERDAIRAGDPNMWNRLEAMARDVDDAVSDEQYEARIRADERRKALEHAAERAARSQAMKANSNQHAVRVAMDGTMDFVDWPDPGAMGHHRLRRTHGHLPNLRVYFECDSALAQEEPKP